MTYLRGVHDFKSFLKGIRPRSADRDIQTQFGLQFRVIKDGRHVQVRSKDTCSLQVPFGPWYQMLPHPKYPDAVPHRDNVPPLSGTKEWPEFSGDIVPTLLPFYKSEFRHSVHIPDADREEMVNFLTHGPPTNAAPAWIDWTDRVDREPVEVAETESAAVVTKERPAWRPFLKPRKKFPFPVGTWVAFEFDGDLFPGVIGEVFDDDELCRVDFADGDKADYDADEIHYATQLYQREFNS